MLQYAFVFAAGLRTGKHLLKGISLQKSELLWHLTLKFKNKQLRSQHKSLTLELKCWEQGQELGDRSPLTNLNTSFQWGSAALCPAAPMLKSSCQTLTCQHCLVCHNCTTTSRGDLQEPKHWMVRQLHKTAGGHAEQAASNPNRNKRVKHQHSDADEKKMRLTQSKLSCGRPVSTTKPVRETGEARPPHPERKSPAIVWEEVEAHPPLHPGCCNPPQAAMGNNTASPGLWSGAGFGYCTCWAPHVQRGRWHRKGICVYVCVCVLWACWSCSGGPFLKEAVQPVAQPLLKPTPVAQAPIKKWNSATWL